MLEQIAHGLHAAMLPIATITGALMLIAGMVFTCWACIDYSLKTTRLVMDFAQFVVARRDRAKQQEAPAPRLKRREAPDV